MIRVKLIHEAFVSTSVGTSGIVTVISTGLQKVNNFESQAGVGES